MLTTIEHLNAIAALEHSYQQESIYILCRSHLQFSSAECKYINRAYVEQNIKKLELAQNFAARGKFDSISQAFSSPGWLAVKDL